VQLDSFIKKIKAILPNVSFSSCSFKSALIHPYMSADVVVDNQVVGYVSKLHPKVAKDFDINSAFICEINIDKLEPKLKVAKPFSKYQSSTRDLSVVIDSNIPFCDIQKQIDSLNIAEIKEFWASDIYSSSDLVDKISLTIRFVLQSKDGVINEEVANTVMDKILQLLSNKFNATLR
jgi:phenylalanyl-tRNA synthetase beta chain